MSPKILSILSVILFLLVKPALVLASPLITNEIPPSTLSYLQSQQQPDGGMPGLSGVSDPGTTARTLLAFKGLGIDAAALTNSNGVTASQYLIENYASYTYDEQGLLFPASAGLVLAAIPKINDLKNPLADEILASRQADGSFATDAASDFASGSASASNQIFALLGLSAAAVEVPPDAVQYLIDLQLEDGTWDNGFGSDPDTTAAAVIALLSSGQVANNHPSIVEALEFFRNTQLDNSAWRPAWDSSDINVDTSGWIALALVTAGEDPANWSKNAQTLVDAILTQLQPDGSIGGEYVNVYSTVEALLGLANSPLFPISTPVSQSQPVESRAGLVITRADGSSLLRCINFPGESISGLDFLTASNFKLETAIDPLRGMAICSIENEGCPASNCFCDMPNYWSYWHLQDGAWSYASGGAGTYPVANGTVEGWTYSNGIEPPVVTFEQICAPNATLFLPAVVARPAIDSSPTLKTDSTPTAIPASTASQVPGLLLYGLILVVLVAILLVLILKRSKQNG